MVVKSSLMLTNQVTYFVHFSTFTSLTDLLFWSDLLWLHLELHIIIMFSLNDDDSLYRDKINYIKLCFSQVDYVMVASWKLKIDWFICSFARFSHKLDSIIFWTFFMFCSESDFLFLFFYYRLGRRYYQFNEEHVKI
jgi:hypothetical protein